jgi:hypothetical protein
VLGVWFGVSRVWFVYGFFVFGALVDLVGTVWNLSFLGYGFEGNPLIANWWGAVLVKLVLLIIVGVVIKLSFVKASLFNKFAFVSLFVIGGLAQLLAGSVHLYVITQYIDSDELVVTDRGDVLVMNEGVVTQTLRPEIEGVEKLSYYLKVVSVFILYPYILGLLSFSLFLWVTRNVTV